MIFFVSCVFGCVSLYVRCFAQTLVRVDLNEGCFLGFLQYFPEISVFLGINSFLLLISRKIPKFRENTKKTGKRSSLTPLEPHSHMWGQNTLIMSSLSPKRDWGSKRVKSTLISFRVAVPCWGRNTCHWSDLPPHMGVRCYKRACGCAQEEGCRHVLLEGLGPTRRRRVPCVSVCRCFHSFHTM